MVRASRYSGLAEAVGRPPSQQDQIARLLARDILTGKLQPGDRVGPEEQLLDRFGVSRVVIREVFKTLAAKGLVTARQRVGVQVAGRDDWALLDRDVLGWWNEFGIDADALRDFDDLRQGLAAHAGRLAAVRRDEGDLADLHLARDRLAATETADDGAAAAAFRRLVGRATHNPLIAHLADLLDALDDTPTSATLTDYDRLISRVADQDAAGAADAMRHLMPDLVCRNPSVNGAAR